MLTFFLGALFREKLQEGVDGQSLCAVLAASSRQLAVVCDDGDLSRIARVLDLFKDVLIGGLAFGGVDDFDDVVMASRSKRKMFISSVEDESDVEVKGRSEIMEFFDQ